MTGLNSQTDTIPFHSTTPCFRNAATSASEYPNPASTSSLCCPNAGAAVGAGPGVSAKAIGLVIVR